MALNMAANDKISEKKRYNVVALASDGNNVRTWMLSFNNMLHMHQLNHMSTEHYSMYVRARETLSINIKAQAERDIKQRRVEHAANDRNAGHIDVKTEDGATTREMLKSNISATTREMLKKQLQAEEEAAEETKELVSEQVNARARARRKKEDKRRACALAMALEVEEKQGESEGQRGDHEQVSFLDPLSMLHVSDSDDDEEVCHRHTLRETEHRYAVERREVTKVRMLIDTSLAQSISAIPAHITVGVMPGDIYRRYKRVCTHYDNISTQVRKAAVDNKVNTLSFRERESFDTFTSRFRAIEHEMEDVGLMKDPSLVLAALQKAIGSTKSESKREVYRAYRVLGGGKCKEELLRGLKEPMIEAEQRMLEDAPAKKAQVLYQQAVQHQEQVNALHVAQHGKGGRGGGGRGASGGRGGKGKGGKGNTPCLRFAKGKCTFTNCYYKHISLNAQQITDLEAKVQKAKEAKTANGGAPPHKVSKAKHTDALENTMAECRGLGMNDELMLRLTSLIFSEKQ
jgi:hypothetical protein